MPAKEPKLENGRRAAYAMEFFDVYVLRFEVNEERATRALMQVFGLSEAAARIFVHSVPRVGKREVPTAMAERYVRALHGVGAVVECRRTGSAPVSSNTNAQRQPQMSLPAPSDEPYPGAGPVPHIMQDSLGIMGPLAFSPDMPQIPKAPRIPADLHHIRARKGPDSLAPNWRATRNDNEAARAAAAAARNSLPYTRGGGGSADGAGAQGMSSGAGLWSDPHAMQLSNDPMNDLQAQRQERNDRDDRDDREDRADHARQQHGEPAQSEPRFFQDRGAHPSPSSLPVPQSLSSPALSPSPFAGSRSTASDDRRPWYATATNQLLLAALVIAGMAIALSTGVFETDVNRTARAFQQAGINPGTYEPAERYLAQPANRFPPLQNEQLQALVDRLSQAGAREVWVADIKRDAGVRTSNTLLLDLPPDPGARRALFEELASTQRAGQLKTPDVGQRFLRVDF